jgi:hypothetical protein
MDFQFGWNQITSCLVADVVLFNSEWNRNSFLSRLEPFLNKIPTKDVVSGTRHLRAQITEKSRYLPLSQHKSFVLPGRSARLK